MFLIPTCSSSPLYLDGGGDDRSPCSSCLGTVLDLTGGRGRRHIHTRMLPLMPLLLSQRWRMPNCSQSCAQLSRILSHPPPHTAPLFDHPPTPPVAPICMPFSSPPTVLLILPPPKPASPPQRAFCRARARGGEMWHSDRRQAPCAGRAGAGVRRRRAGARRPD